MQCSPTTGVYCVTVSLNGKTEVWGSGVFDFIFLLWKKKKGDSTVVWVVWVLSNDWEAG